MNHLNQASQLVNEDDSPKHLNMLSISCAPTQNEQYRIAVKAILACGF